MKTIPTKQQMKEPPLSDIFEIKTANDWIAASKQKPVPQMLFGEFWLEGELAILFADTGKGKSLLAVQIGESIARGFSISPMKMTAKPQKVLYFDFELTDKQFEMRYAKNYKAGDGEQLRGHYEFSDSFCRLEIKLDATVPQGHYTFENYLRHSIERVVKESGAKVLIIDNITYLRRSNESTREAVPLMRELKRLRELYGLSILVLAHTPKRDSSRPITVNDLQGSKVMSNFADNIFAIGQSKLDPAGRYIKHIKPRSTVMTYDASNVPYFRITKSDGRFLGFQHQGFASETVHLADANSREWELVETIKRSYDRGMSIRQIAIDLKMSKSAVHRLLKKWMGAVDADDEYSDDHVMRGPREHDPKQSPYYFPGREEYDALNEQLGFMEHLNKNDPESVRRIRQGWELEKATAEASRIYRQTGKAPRLAEMLAKLPEFADSQ